MTDHLVICVCVLNICANFVKDHIIVVYNNVIVTKEIRTELAKFVSQLNIKCIYTIPQIIYFLKYSIILLSHPVMQQLKRYISIWSKSIILHVYTRRAIKICIKNRKRIMCFN